MNKDLNSFEEVDAGFRRIYGIARALNPNDALRMALEADDTEEKRFYTYIATMNLDRRHEEEFKEYISLKDDEVAEQRIAERRKENSCRTEAPVAEAKKLFNEASALGPACMKSLQDAKTKEEQRFYVYISDMNLQRAQKEVIRKNLF